MHLIWRINLLLKSSLGITRSLVIEPWSIIAALSTQDGIANYTVSGGYAHQNRRLSRKVQVKPCHSRRNARSFIASASGSQPSWPVPFLGLRGIRRARHYGSYGASKVRTEGSPNMSHDSDCCRSKYLSTNLVHLAQLGQDAFHVADSNMSGLPVLANQSFGRGGTVWSHTNSIKPQLTKISSSTPFLHALATLKWLEQIS